MSYAGKPLWILAFLLAVTLASTGSATDKPIADFKLRDYQGKEYALADFAKAKLVVVAFIGVDCPLANRYADRLAEMAKEYEPKGVAFLAIDSNQQDSLPELAHMAKKHKLEFPLLKDPGNAIADRFGAKRTPEVFVLDALRNVRYQGRVDDQYGIGYQQPAPKERDLIRTLDELLAGKAVSKPLTEASGCFIGKVKREAPRGDITYTNQVARLIQSHCVNCHRTGGIAPFSLTSYQEVAAWAETIGEVVHDRRMPPWDASPKVGKFVDDPSLSEAEVKLIEQWVENGVPEGDRKNLPKPAQFTDGWRIPKPDQILTMPKMYRVQAKGVLPYQYFTVDPGFMEDKWVRASEVRPGNPSVVHHVVVIVQPPGAPSPELTGGIGDPVAVGAPGTAPLNFPEGCARYIPAGSKLVFQIHYTPNGVEQIDRTSVGLVFADPKKVVRAMKAEIAVNVKFRIPPGDSNFIASADYRFDQEAILYSLFPHMHLRGKSFQIEAEYPDKRREVLLHVPRYRFDWQNRYALAEPLRVPEGTVLHCVAHFDNSVMNLSNPDPKVEVRFGEQTWNEMLVGYFDLALADQDLRLGLPKAKALSDDQYEVLFHYQAKPGTKFVYLAGEFNNWSTTDHKMDGPDAQNRFTSKQVLKAGSHQYKFVVDGKDWRYDPGNPRQVGMFNNSLLTLPPKLQAVAPTGAGAGLQ
jgi:peroxiredoxin/mono/diheme cytochrome c family protein